MMLPTSETISSDLRLIYERMNVDEISNTCKTDPTIIKYGNKLCRKHANNDDHSKYISNKLRELGKLTVKMKSHKEVNCLDDIISPVLFSKVVQAVSELCGWDPITKRIKSPSLVNKIGQLLGKIASIVATSSIQSGNYEDRKRGKVFIMLLDTEWGDEISKRSRIELDVRK